MKCYIHYHIILVFSSFMTAVSTTCTENQTSVCSYPAASNIYNSSFSTCECEKCTCIRKCCDFNYYLDSNEMCIYNNSLKLKVPIYKYGSVIIDDELNKDFAYGMVKCAFGENRKELDLNLVHVQKDGKLWLPKIHMTLEYKRYCLENTDVGETSFMCIDEEAVRSLALSYRLNILGMVISLPFLLVTFVVYAILPLRNLHGMSLMCYVLALFVTYFTHILDYMYVDSKNFDTGTCKATGILASMYFFLSSFFWMNVMSYDIWWTFTGFVNLRTMKEKSEWKYFLYYSIYAWGSPLLIVGFVLSLRNNVKPSTWYDPGLTDHQCSLTDGIPTLLYYYGPMAILLIANIILFIITAYKIKLVQQDTVMLQKGDNRASHTDSKERFYLYLKLFLAMGVNWSMEIISYVVSWKFGNVSRTIWYLTDFYNATFGLVIFFIFVFKKSIWNLLEKRYGMTTKKPCLQKPIYKNRSNKGSLIP